MENLTPNENEILNAINANPGIGAGLLGRRLGLDRNYARRVADRLIGFGHATKRDNGQGFGFYPANGGSSPSTSISSSNGHAGPLDGVIFRDITPSSASRQLVPSGAGQPFDSRTEDAVRQHDEARRRAALQTPAAQAMGREVIRTWDGLYGATAHPAAGFRAFDDDASEMGHSYDGLVYRAGQEDMTALQGALAAKDRELADKDRRHAEELAAIKAKADNDMRLGSLTRSMTTPSAAASPSPKPKSLLQEAREERAVRKAEAAEAEQARFRRSVAEQMEMYPPDENFSLYSHLRAEDWPDEWRFLLEDDDEMDDTETAPRKSLSDILAKPNGHVEPEPVEGMSMGIKWGLAALTVGAIVAAVIRFPLR